MFVGNFSEFCSERKLSHSRPSPSRIPIKFPKLVISTRGKRDCRTIAKKLAWRPALKVKLILTYDSGFIAGNEGIFKIIITWWSCLSKYKRKTSNKWNKLKACNRDWLSGGWVAVKNYPIDDSKFVQHFDDRISKKGTPPAPKSEPQQAPVTCRHENSAERNSIKADLSIFVVKLILHNSAKMFFLINWEWNIHVFSLLLFAWIIFT